MLRSHILRGSGLAEGTITFTDSSSNASDINATSYTSPSLNIGEADVNRQVYVSIAASATSLRELRINTCTIGGINATKVAEQEGTAFGAHAKASYIFRANVPTGTTATVYVENSADFGSPDDLQDVTIAVYSTLNFSTTPIDTFGTRSNTASIVLNGLITGSAVIAVMSSDGNGQENNYTNLTIDYDDTVHDGTDTYVHYSAIDVSSGTFTAASSSPSFSNEYTAVAIALRPI